VPKPRYKITFADEAAAQCAAPHAWGCAPSKVRYVYGDDHPLLQWPAIQIDNAGHYDADINTCVLDEPTSCVDGRAAPGA